MTNASPWLGLSEDVIGTADRMLAAVQRGDVAPVGLCDPEAWTIKRAFARRILDAVESGGRVDPAWLFAIGRARAGMKPLGHDSPDTATG